MGKRLWGSTRCHQYNGRERYLPWCSAATGPHRLVDGHLGITPAISHSRPYLLTMQHSQAFPQPPEAFFTCWAAPHRPSRLAAAQPGDQRKSPKTVTETQRVYWTGLGLTCTQKSSWSNTLTVCRRQNTTATFPTQGRRGAAIYRGNWRQVGSLELPGKPASGAGAKPAGSYRLSPIIKRTGEFCEWNRAGSSRRCPECKRMAILSGLTIHRVKRHLLKSIYVASNICFALVLA